MVTLIHTLTLAYAWATAHAWLLGAGAVVLSNAATGLTDYPQAAGVIPTLRKIAGLLSVLEHLDHPNYMKMPFLPASRPLKAPGPQVSDTVQRGAVPLVVVLVIAGVAAIGGLFGILLATKHSGEVLSCADAAIQKLLPAVQSDVYNILNGDVPNVQGALDQLLTAEGSVVECAVAAIIKNGGFPLVAASSVANVGIIRVHPELVKANGVAWLRSHGVEAKF